MSSTIDESFTEEYRREAIEQHQKRGSILRGMTRRATLLEANTARWQKFGTFSAVSNKGRGQDLTPQDPLHSYVQTTIADHYVPSLVDDLDLLKQNIDEMTLHAAGHAYAMGRKEDEVVYDALIDVSGANSVKEQLGPGNGGALFTVSNLLAIGTAFDLDQVPMSDRYCAVSPETWNRMITFDEFANADYVGAGELPYEGPAVMAKMWNGIFWFSYAEVPRSNDGVTIIPRPYDKSSPSYAADLAAWKAAKVHHNVAWYTGDVGFDGQLEPRTTMGWENLKQAHSIVTAMALAAVTIQPEGVKLFTVDINGATANP